MEAQFAELAANPDVIVATPGVEGFFWCFCLSFGGGVLCVNEAIQPTRLSVNVTAPMQDHCTVRLRPSRVDMQACNALLCAMLTH
jgi:hypothetical protein